MTNIDGGFGGEDQYTYTYNTCAMCIAKLQIRFVVHNAQTIATTKYILNVNGLAGDMKGIYNVQCAASRKY